VKALRILRVFRVIRIFGRIGQLREIVGAVSRSIVPAIQALVGLPQPDSQDHLFARATLSLIFLFTCLLSQV
jgi:hypothetical protein